MAYVAPEYIMVYTPQAYQASQERVAVQGFPVVSMFSSVAQTIQDLALKMIQASRIDELKSLFPNMLYTGSEAADYMKAGGPTGNVAALLSEIKRIYTGLYDNWKAGIWGGVGSVWSSAMEQFIGAGQLLYAYKTLMQQTAIHPRMRRYWNSIYTPQVPDAAMAWHLYRKGALKYVDFVKYASYDGWDKIGAAQLDEAFDIEPSASMAFKMWAMGLISTDKRNSLYFASGYKTTWNDELSWIFSKVPSAYDGFSMWRKGLIPENRMYAMFHSDGYMPGWDTVLRDNFYHTFSLRELTSLADFVELDQTWVVKNLKASNFRDEDTARLWNLLQLRPLREEVRTVTARWSWRLRMGRCSMDDMDHALLTLSIKAKERELLEIAAQMYYEDELVDEWIEILRWRFRTAVITEEEFLDGLIDLGIRAEKANLIVETEKAMGYYGYY